jgi:hypothetical protein
MSDICVLDMAVAESRNGEGVRKQLQVASKKVEHSPLYLIIDNASIMNKGAKLAGIKHYHDISHSLCMYLERTYKKETDFMDYIKQMTEPNCKYNMKKIAFLLSPKQRTIARFQNLSGWVQWSEKMLYSYHRLTAEGKEIFSFVPANASLIDELSEVMECTQSIEYIFKHFGFSKKTAGECRRKVEQSLLLGNSRMIKLGNEIIQFIEKEEALLNLLITAHNNSSDILESLFGTFKARKSPNKLYGITPFILFLPIYAKLKGKEAAKLFDFKTALENIKLSDIDCWTDKNLSANLVNMRTKWLKKIG